MANILVVDDDRDVASALAMLLQLDGHTVRYAEDGQAGLEALNGYLPEVVCLDVDMPRLNGPDLAYRLIVEDAGKELIPIILVSGVANLVQVAQEVGTPYFVRKPFSLEAIEVTLARALKEHCAPHPPRKEGFAVEPRR
ncbi:MAG TPA: response regulator [Polyangiaceae bacterium]